MCCYRGLCLRSSCDSLHTSRTVGLSLLSLLFLPLFWQLYMMVWIFLYNKRQLVPSLHFRSFLTVLFCVSRAKSLFPQQQTYTQQKKGIIIWFRHCRIVDPHTIAVGIVFVCYSFRLFACKFVLLCHCLDGSIARFYRIISLFWN